MQPALSERLELQVLGPVRVARGTQSLRVQTPTGKALLVLLLEARLEGRVEIPDLELIDRLFAQVPERRARDALKNLVYRLRTATSASLITRTPMGYALGEVSSDAERFLETGSLADWRGSYSADVAELAVRGAVRSRLAAALLKAAQAQLLSSPASTVRAARVLVDMEPYDEDVLRLLLGALRTSNNRRDLQRAYRSAQQRLLEVDVRLPDSWLDFLAQP